MKLKDRIKRSAKVRAMKILARFDLVRDASRLLDRGRPFQDSTKVSQSVFRDLDSELLFEQLDREGIVFGLDLPAPLVEEIRTFAENETVYGDCRPELGFALENRSSAESQVGKSFTLGGYFNTHRCPAVQTLREDPLLWELARRYVGSDAKLASSQLWWSFEGERSAEEQNLFAQKFHYDLDDYRFLKFFFYLTDVDAESGPHVYVRGSHRGKPVADLFPLRRFSDDEVAARFSDNRILSIEGKAGTGFAEDTFGIHKGTTPTHRPRLLLQFEFARDTYGFADDRRESKSLQRIA